MMDMLYDYLVVGAGLYGSVFAYRASQMGKKVLVIDKREHIGGNLYCERIEGINVHKYGAHIFHTSNKQVWDFVNSFVEFNHYRNAPIACYKGKIYNLPFNMNTFYSLWGVTTPQEAERVIREQQESFNIDIPRNLEEQAIKLVGRDIYEILIKGYTEKQWGRKATDLPSFIIKRLPLRFVYDNNYFNDIYQGIPIGGYNVLIEKLLLGIECRLNIDFFENRSHWESIARKIVFTGRIDEYYNFRFGRLNYRSLSFEHQVLDCDNYQGNAVVNYTDVEIPYTRIIEHKHFEFGNQSKTVITKEYPLECIGNEEPYYPINNEENLRLYDEYRKMADLDSKVHFGGRLAEYQYYDMHKIIENVLNLDWV